MRMASAYILLSISLLTMIGPDAHAWDGAVSGVITRIDMPLGGVGGAPGNYDLRVTLSGSPTLCTGGSNWAYINSTEANYNAVTAALLSAKAIGSNVAI